LKELENILQNYKIKLDHLIAKFPDVFKHTDRKQESILQQFASLSFTIFQGKGTDYVSLSKIFEENLNQYITSIRLVNGLRKSPPPSGPSSSGSSSSDAPPSLRFLS
jgi:hypothetical protein